MKRIGLIAVLVLAAGTVPAAWGQRGGARGGGGFSGRGGGGFSGGFSAGSRFSYGATRTAAGSGYARSVPGFRGAPVYPVRRPAYGGAQRYRAPYGYGVGVVGWLGPDYFGYPDAPYDAGTNYGSASAPSYAPSDPDGSYPGGYGPGPVPPAVDPYRPAYSRPAAEPKSEEAVTLIFKDGRPAEQIHNFILSKTTVHVFDDRRRDVPVDDLDLVATAKVNRAAGVDFELPGTR